MEVSSRGRNALLTALGVLVALVVVAIAARGSIPTGEGGTRGPTQALIDILFTLYLLAIASAVVLARLPPRPAPPDRGAGRHGRGDAGRSSGC